MKSEVLKSSDQDLHKINPDSIPAWVGDWLTNPQTNDHLAGIDTRSGRVSFVLVWSLVVVPMLQ